MEEGKIINKRGRPSAENNKKRKFFAYSAQPSSSIRGDQTAHWPAVDDTRRICRMQGCSSRTNVVCSKCNIHLCFNAKNNHFTEYHK